MTESKKNWALAKLEAFEKGGLPAMMEVEFQRIAEQVRLQMAAAPKRKRRLPEGLFTPQQIAGKYAVDVDKVHQWIRSGQLKAVNIATNPDGRRPRYAVPQMALDEFEAGRTIQSPQTRPQRRRQRPKDYKEFH